MNIHDHRVAIAERGDPLSLGRPVPDHDVDHATLIEVPRDRGVDLLERQGKMDRIVTDEEINTAVHVPPNDTRAFFRGECLRRYPQEVFGVNWDSISFGIDEAPIKRIMMSEPLKGTRAYVEELLDQSETAAKLLENMGV